MEQGGMHRHTGFHVVEVALGIVLVLVVALFYLWNGRLNDQIAVLESRQDIEVEGESVLQTDPRVLELEGGQWIELRPLEYQVSLRGDGPSPFYFEVDYPLPTVLEEESWFRETTHSEILAVDHYGYYESPETNLGTGIYLSQSLRKGIQLQSETFVTGDVAKIIFGADQEAEFTLSTNVVNAACDNEVPSFLDGDVLRFDYESWVAQCNNETPASVSVLLVNGDVAITFEPVSLEHRLSGRNSGMGLSPAIYIYWLGVSPDLTLAYFTFLGKTYSIDEAGAVVETGLPDELVTMTDEEYE